MHIYTHTHTYAQAQNISEPDNNVFLTGKGTG